MTTTPAPTAARADVEARAREVIATSLIGRRVPVNKHGRVDDIGIGGQVGRQFSSLALTALTAANLRIVSAEADDRRTEAIRAFEEFVHVIDGGASMGIDHGLSAGFARRKLDPYLHDDDTGGKGVMATDRLKEQLAHDAFTERGRGTLTYDERLRTVNVITGAWSDTCSAVDRAEIARLTEENRALVEAVEQQQRWIRTTRDPD